MYSILLHTNSNLASRNAYTITHSSQVFLLSLFQLITSDMDHIQDVPGTTINIIIDFVKVVKDFTHQ